MSAPIIEYKVSRDSKYYVVSNIDFKGQGIKKTGNGKDHKRGLMSFLITQNALNKIKAVHKCKYIESDY